MMEHTAGLEPATSGFVNRRSDPLSYVCWCATLDLNQDFARV